MSSTVEASKCQLIFYQRDEGSDLRWSKKCELSIDEKTTQKTYDLVAAHFGLDQEWDKKLLKTIFYSKIQYDWIEFTKADSPKVSYAVRIEGNRTLISEEMPQESFDPVKSEDRISVSFSCLKGFDKYELNYEKLSTGRTKDPAIIAFFNNKSIKQITEFSTKMGISRTLEQL